MVRGAASRPAAYGRGSRAGSRSAKPRSVRKKYLNATAGHGRQDGHRIPVLDRGVQAGQEADVLVVEVHVDEPPQAGVVHQALAKPAVFAIEVDQDLTERGSGPLDLLGAVGVGAQDRRDANLDGHEQRSFLYALVPTRHGPGSFHHGHRLLGDVAVLDVKGAELGLVLVAGRDQHVVRAGLAGVGHVGARGVGLGGGVRVVQDDGFLVVVVHLFPHLELLGGVEFVERRRARGVGHRDEAFRAIGAGRARDYSARLVRVVAAGVRDDLVVYLFGNS